MSSPGSKSPTWIKFTLRNPKSRTCNATWGKRSKTKAGRGSDGTSRTAPLPTRSSSNWSRRYRASESKRTRRAACGDSTRAKRCRLGRPKADLHKVRNCEGVGFYIRDRKPTWLCMEWLARRRMALWRVTVRGNRTGQHARWLANSDLRRYRLRRAGIAERNGLDWTGLGGTGYRKIIFTCLHEPITYIPTVVETSLRTEGNSISRHYLT